MPNCGCLHQVGLAHSDATIKEERVVRLRGAFRNCLTRGVGELISAADDKRVEGVPRVELRRPVPIEA
jgi:hypothetical protein